MYFVVIFVTDIYLFIFMNLSHEAHSLFSGVLVNANFSLLNLDMSSGIDKFITSDSLFYIFSLLCRMDGFLSQDVDMLKIRGYEVPLVRMANY